MNTSNRPPVQRSKGWVARALSAIFVERRMPTFIDKRINRLMIFLGFKTKIVTVGSFRIRVNRLNADHGFAKNIIEECEYRCEDFDVQKNDAVIDVGANIGSFALYASRKSGTGKVYSLEPFPENFDLLKDNLKRNHIENVTPLQLAVAKDSGTIDFFIANQSGSHSTDDEYFESKNISIINKVTVESISLEELMLQQNISFCDFLKIDCEGAEYEILWSLSEKCYSNIGKIALEYHLKSPSERQQKVDEIEGLLKKHHFHLVEKKNAGPLAGLLFFNKASAK